MDSFNTRPPFLGQRTPDYPPFQQLLRVTGSMISGPAGPASSTPGTGDAPPSVLYVAYTEQLRTDTLAPRDREPCLATEPNGITLAPGYYLGRLAGSYGGLPLYEVIFAASGGSAGPQGPVGPSGIAGAAGPSGAPGPSGSGFPGASSIPGAGSFSGARAYRTTRQSIIAANLFGVTEDSNRIVFGATNYDTDAYFTIGQPTRLTARGDGAYSMGGSVYWKTSTSPEGQTIRGLGIRKNGTTWLRRTFSGFYQAGTPNYFEQSVVDQHRLNNGDYIELIPFTMSSHTPIELFCGPDFTTLAGSFLGISVGDTPVMWIGKLGTF